MDIELVRNFRKLINTNFNELIVSVIEQYNTEIDRLNEVIVSSTALVKEKEDLIGELQKELEDTKFDEDNFNNVSLIHNLNKQVEQLTSQNKLLNTSLEARRKNDKLKAEQKNKVEEEVEVNENNTDNVKNNDDNVEDNHNNVDDNNDNVEDNDNNVENNDDNDDNVENNDDNDDNVENNDDNAEEVVNDTNDNQVDGDNDDDGDKDDEDEETVEVEEIEVNDKSYYVKDGKIYNKKKNGDMGSKPVGEMVDGEPVITKKEKKEKKDKKGKKEKKKGNN